MQFSAEERSQIIAFTLNHPRVASLVKGQQVRALTVASEPDDKEERAGVAPRRLASVVFFNYTAGQAFRAYVDLTNSEVVQVEPLAGRPPASEEELQEARKVLERHSQIKQFLDKSAVIEGGFIVDPPGGAPARDRFIQFHIMSSDRQKIEQVVIVDLTAGQVATTEKFGGAAASAKKKGARP
jgi:hypothetical protein